MRQQYLDYLNSHIEIEHILEDSLEKFGTDNLELLSTEDLENLAYWWDFEETKTN